MAQIQNMPYPGGLTHSVSHSAANNLRRRQEQVRIDITLQRDFMVECPA